MAATSMKFSKKITLTNTWQLHQKMYRSINWKK